MAPTHHATSTDAPAQPIEASPKAGQNITHAGKTYTTIKEGLAHILVPQGTPTSTDPQLSKEETQRQQVFYNPIQQFNRDLSVLAIKTFGQDLTHRKTERHKVNLRKTAQRQQKAQKAKVRAEESKNESGAAAVVNGPTNGQKTAEENFDKDDAHVKAPEDVEKEVSDREGAVSNKRKLSEEDTEADAALPKKQKVVQNGTNGETSMEEPAVATGTTKAPASWQPSFTILDALSATGLRALRYAQEIPFATSVTSNDMSPDAVASIRLNVKHNQLQDKITPNTGNAIAYMYSFCDKKGFDVIDLDPYGTAAPFIDAAIQAINDQGLLCVTCTDSAIFASHGYLEKTYSQYGGLPFKGEQCHEGGLRLVLHAIASSAARYGMAIEPLLSLSIDYYIRVFVRVRKAPNDVKMLAGKTMIVYHCESGCKAWTTQFLARNKETKNKKGDLMYKHGFAQGPSADRYCEHCGYRTHLSGPMYGGPLHNVGFVERVLANLDSVDRETYPTYDRIEGMLHTALEEVTLGMKLEKSKGLKKTQVLDPLIPKADPAEIDRHPFFFTPSTVARTVHCSAPPAAALRGALLHAGFHVAMSHCKPGSIKTNASWSHIWHIMLEWVRQRAPLKNSLKKETPGYAIMSKANGTGHVVRSTAAVGTAPVGTAPQAAESAEDVQKDVQKDAERMDVDAPESQATPKEIPAYRDAKYYVNFDEKLGKDHDRGKLVRYQLAPRENWGPMARAK